jgi:hypothetical protein
MLGGCHRYCPTQRALNWDIMTTMVSCRQFLNVSALFACAFTLGQSARAQSEWVVRDSFEPTAPRLIYTAARSMGMLRGVQEFDIWQTLRYEGAGVAFEVTGPNPSDWIRVELDRYYAEVAYPDNGLRVDQTNSAGERSVWVTVDGYSWNERDVANDGPPVGASQTSAPELYEWRQQLLAITPPAVVKLAHENDDRVRVTELEHRTYELSLPQDNMTIRLNRNRHPELVSVEVDHPVLGQATLTAEYSGYRDYEPIDPVLSDEIMSGFRFPSRIVQKLDGHTILDIEIDTCWCTNAYVIFPIPENIRLASARR